MFSLRNLLLTVAAGLAVAPGLTSAAAAAAPPVIPDRGFAESNGPRGDIVPVAFVCNGYSCWNTGPLYNPLNRPYYRAYSWPIYRPYRPYMPPSPSYQPYSRSVTIYRPYGGPYYAPAVRSGYGSHVGWCANRYRTYNPTTDRYHAGGGVYPVCISPYR